ncbi:MAG: radical SAM protein [Geobacter sp.]|nr:MAG: radical SAM protein [Geobacter sp.]
MVPAAPLGATLEAFPASAVVSEAPNVRFTKIGSYHLQDSTRSEQSSDKKDFLRDKPFKLTAPTKVCLSITSKCNLDCKHCLAKSGQADQDLSTRDIFRVIEELAAEKVFFVSLFGGEPFIRPDILEIVEHLSHFPIGISINTNATLIDDELAERLSKFKISYVVSLDGSSAETVDGIRGKGVFDKTLRGLRALRKQGSKVLISTTVLSQNYHDLGKIAALGKDLGVMGVRFNTVFFINNAECYLDDILLTPQHYLYLYGEFENLKKDYGKFVSGSLLQLMESVKSINENGRPVTSGERELTVQPCGAAVNQCAIKPDGEVLPCVLLWNTPAGNLVQKPFKEIWDTSKTLDEFRMPFTLTEKELADCISCKYRQVCYTGHRCTPYFIPGGIGNKKLFCIKQWL